MKTQNRVSQLTLELYHRGLATRKERKEVEKALLADAQVRKRYEELQELERNKSAFSGRNAPIEYTGNASRSGYT